MSTTPDQPQPRSPEEGAPEGAQMVIVEEAARAEREAAAARAEPFDLPGVVEAVEHQSAADAADTLEDLHEDEAADVLEQMDDAAAAHALAEMHPELARSVLEDLIADDRVRFAAALLGMMEPDDAADLLYALPEHEREVLLSPMSAAKAGPLRRLLGYEVDSAGGLMTTAFLALRDDMTVAQATDVIRRRREFAEGADTLFVVDEGRRLAGRVGLRALLINDPDQRIGDLMTTDIVAVRPETDQEAVAHEFDRYDLAQMPVVDDEGRLIGIITVDDVIDIIRSEHTEDVQKTVGAGAGEAVYSPLRDKFRSRFPWLIVSLLIMVPSALVVLQFEGLIGELAILAVLMPVVAALTGNAGHQALAVTQRGLVLEEVRPDRVWPLLRRELIVGFCTGAALGLLAGLGMIALSPAVEEATWQLAVVVAVSMTLTMSIGTLSGTGIPLLMKRMGADPAAASAIFLIMITDAISFATLLGLAYLAYEWIRPAG